MEQQSAPTKPIRYDTTLTEGKCFLGGLDTGTTKQSLQDYCSPWGEVVDSVVMEGRGFGFVTFADGNAASSFIAHEGGHTIDGKSIEVRVPAVLLGFPPDRTARGGLLVAPCVRSPRARGHATKISNAPTPTYPCPPELIARLGRKVRCTCCGVVRHSSTPLVP